jgi:amidophosphoribosyltransferase
MTPCCCLQHRGQDAAGIVTQQERKFFMHKAKGMVRDVFRTRNMRALPGSVGLGQVRYPTAGNAFSEEEAQPFLRQRAVTASCWCTTAT